MADLVEAVRSEGLEGLRSGEPVRIVVLGGPGTVHLVAAEQVVDREPVGERLLVERLGWHDRRLGLRPARRQNVERVYRQPRKLPRLTCIRSKTVVVLLVEDHNALFCKKAAESGERKHPQTGAPLYVDAS